MKASSKKKKIVKFSTLSNVIKFLAWFFPLLISGYALRQASTSTKIANDSNKISNESNRIAKESLVMGQRPYLTVAPSKFKENDSFIFTKETDRGMELRVKIEISNKGNSIAKNLKYPDLHYTSEETLYTEPQIVFKTEVKAKTPNDISLAPGESVFVEIVGEFPIIDRRAVLDNLEQIKGGKFSLPFNIEINYAGSLEQAIQGKTTLSLVIWTDKVDIKYQTMD